MGTTDRVHTPTRTPTATPTPTARPMDLPDEVRASQVAHVDDLPSNARDVFERARDSKGEWIETPRGSVVETFDDVEYVYDGRLWVVSVDFGTLSYYASTVNLSADERAVPYESLSAAERERFREIVTSVTYDLGPGERAIDFPDPIRYENETYVVERGYYHPGGTIVGVYLSENSTDESG